MRKLFFSLLMAASVLCTYSCEDKFEDPLDKGDAGNTSDKNDLPKDASANCYIVSESGSYKFKTVKGNSSESVGPVASAEVLWESFGTAETPEVGSLISEVAYQDNYVTFSTPGTFREGNAVIAAKDAEGTILWSWHIWLTDQPKEHVYNNDAGIMMDRNLGATSATPGDVGALGLLYQWGRKDPFLGGSSISYSEWNNQQQAESTITADEVGNITWPSPVSSDALNGTIEFVTGHPTTFITYNDSNYDWYYTGNSTTDNTRWQSVKTIYDPCPAGYRVPDGGSNGIWSTAFGTSEYFNQDAYDYTNRGFDFGDTTVSLISGPTCWYPAAGYLYNGDGSLGYVGLSSYYWSCSPGDGNYAYSLYFGSSCFIHPSYFSYRALGQSVRCARE